MSAEVGGQSIWGLSRKRKKTLQLLAKKVAKKTKVEIQCCQSNIQLKSQKKNYWKKKSAWIFFFDWLSWCAFMSFFCPPASGVECWHVFKTITSTFCTVVQFCLIGVTKNQNKFPWFIVNTYPKETKKLTVKEQYWYNYLDVYSYNKLKYGF